MCASKLKRPKLLAEKELRLTNGFLVWSLLGRNCSIPDSWPDGVLGGSVPE
jgi:hypothetical protein